MYLHYYTYMTEQYIENIFVSTKRAWAIFIPDYSYSMVVWLQQAHYWVAVMLWISGRIVSDTDYSIKICL